MLVIAGIYIWLNHNPVNQTPLIVKAPTAVVKAPVNKTQEQGQPTTAVKVPDTPGTGTVQTAQADQPQLSVTELLNEPIDVTLSLNRKKIDPDFASADPTKPVMYRTVIYDDGTRSREFDPSGKGGTIYLTRDELIPDMVKQTAQLVSNVNGKVIGTHIDTKDSNIGLQFMLVSIPQNQYDYFIERINAMFDGNTMDSFESITDTNHEKTGNSDTSCKLKIIFNNIK